MGTGRGTAPEPLAILGSLTGVAVIVAGGFYLIGIVTTCAEMLHADVSIRDTVAMLPLDQLLSRGVSLVLYVIGSLGLLAALLAFGKWVEGGFKQQMDAQLELIAEVVPEAERQSWLARARSETSKTDWPALRGTLAVAATHADEESRKTIKRYRRKANLVNAPFVVLYVALLVSAFLMPWVFSIAAFATAAVWLAMDAQPLVRQMTIASALFLVAFLISPWADPRPLPNATIKTDTIGTVSGDLLFVQDGRWYITAPGRAMRIVEPDHIDSATINYSERREPLYEILLDAIEEL